MPPPPPPPPSVGPREVAGTIPVDCCASPPLIVAMGYIGEKKSVAESAEESRDMISIPLVPLTAARSIWDLAPRSIGFGVGRKLKLKYYQYTSTQSTADDNDLDADIGEPVTVDFDENDSESRARFSLLKLWQYTGPGWLMSVAYLDPGNLESDLQCGAVAGYSLIWVLFWATALGWCLQTLAVRMGTVTGRHLAEMCRAEYGKRTALALWLLTEMAIIGSDIQEVVGSAVALSILFGWPLWLGCLITALDALTFLLLHYFGMRVLESFFTSLIGVMAVCFMVEFTISKPNVSEIGEGWLVPAIRGKDDLRQAVGMLGAVIMPHNLFLHSALVQNRRIQRTSVAALNEANFYFTVESGLSLFVSFLINLCVVSVFAAGFYQNPEYPPSEMGLKHASDALSSKFGSTAKYVWAVGLLAAGQCSTMCGALAGQFVMQGFLELHWPKWQRTLLTRSVALIPALIVAIMATTHLDELDEWLNVQQSVLLPFALLPLFFFSSDRRVMGRFALSRKMQCFYWAVVALVIGVNTYLIFEFAIDGHFTSAWRILLFSLFVLVYFGAISMLVRNFLKYQRKELVQN